MGFVDILEIVIGGPLARHHAEYLLQMAEDPKWKIYEKVAIDIERQYPNCTVTHDHKVTGRRSGIERQVDIWLSGQVGQHEVNDRGRMPLLPSPSGYQRYRRLLRFYR